MMGKLDLELLTFSPDLTKISQLKHGLEEKVDMLELLDEEILNYIADEASLTDETEQSDDFKGALRSHYLS